MKARVIERGTPVHRVWQLVGWAIVFAAILVLAKGQPNYRLLLMCNAVVLSDYAKGVLDDAVVSRVTKLAHAAGKFVALDPKPDRPPSLSGRM